MALLLRVLHHARSRGSLALLTAALLLASCGDGGDGDADTSPADPCAGVSNACAAAGAACDGDALVRCVADAGGCLIEQRVDCAASGDGVCARDGEGEAACSGPDLCAGLALCAAASRVCEGDTLVTCAADVNGCLVRRATDCAALDATCDPDASPVACTGGVCGDEQGACVEEGVSCDDVARLRLCTLDSRGCFFEQRIPCSADGTCEPDPEGGVRCAYPCVPPPLCEALGLGEGRCAGATIESCVDGDQDGCPERAVTDCGVGACVEDDGQPVCDAPGVLIMGTSDFVQGFSADNFTPLVDGGDVPVYRGFQGTWMVVVSLKSRGLLAEPVDMTLTLWFDDVVISSVSLADREFMDGEDGYRYFPMIFMDMGVYDPPPVGQAARLALGVNDALGKRYEVEVDLVVSEQVDF